MFDQWEAGLRVNYWWKQAECYNRDGKLYDEKCHCCWLSRTFPAFKWMKFSGNKSAADIFRKTTALSCRFLDILTPNWYIYSTLVCLYFFFARRYQPMSLRECNFWQVHTAKREKNRLILFLKLFEAAITIMRLNTTIRFAWRIKRNWVLKLYVIARCK